MPPPMLAGNTVPSLNWLGNIIVQVVGPAGGRPARAGNGVLVVVGLARQRRQGWTGLCTAQTQALQRAPVDAMTGTGRRAKDAFKCMRRRRGIEAQSHGSKTIFGTRIR